MEEPCSFFHEESIYGLLSGRLTIHDSKLLDDGSLLEPFSLSSLLKEYYSTNLDSLIHNTNPIFKLIEKDE